MNIRVKMPKTKNKVALWQLTQRQGLPLQIKIQLTKRRIREFYNAFRGQVYIAYSGGKDSEVLMHLVHSCYKNIKVVFVDTGMELETREHAIKKANVVLKPKIAAYNIWVKYGIPFPSKQQANFIYKVKHTKSEYLRNRLMTGIMQDGSKTVFRVSKKWKPIINSDIEVSDKCCYYLKKEPFNRYNKQTGERPFIGTMASDGMERKKQYLQTGCINLKREVCTPLGFWTEQDILKYIVDYKLDYCKKAYGNIIKVDGKLKTTNARRTGCVNCLFGIQLEKEPNRLQRLSISNPRQHKVFLDNWVGGKVRKLLDMFKIKYDIKNQQEVLYEIYK